MAARKSQTEKKATPKATPTKETAQTSAQSTQEAPAQTQAPYINKVVPQHELHTGDITPEQAPDIIMPNEGPMMYEAEPIQLMDKPLENDYAAALAFNEELLTIHIEPSGEENAPKAVGLYVNGQPVWIPVGRNVEVKRKFVEVLARSKPDDIRTEHEGTEVEKPENRVVRNTRAKFPFSVLRDPNPKGREWLIRIAAGR